MNDQQINNSAATHCRRRGYGVADNEDGTFTVVTPAGTREQFDQEQLRSLAIINQWEAPNAEA